MSEKVLLVDDDPLLLKVAQLELRAAGIETVTAATGKEALLRMEEDEPVAVVLDLNLPDAHGRDIIQKAKAQWPALEIVVLTGSGDLESAVECMRLGAIDYIHKPYDPTRLVTSVRNAREAGLLKARVASLVKELRGGSGLASMIGAAPAFKRALDMLSRAARSDVTVLLEGESGTGKEVAACAIHAEGSRKTAPFVVVNCGAIPENLIESELFGHEKGSFTGAVARREGRFEEADGGTIFLDEIGEMRLDLQVKLLRVLQERQFQRVGGGAAHAVNVRVIAATNRDLRAEVTARRFREDLYYRLAVFPVRLPPLRERKEDVLLLARAFLERLAVRHGKSCGGFTREAERALSNYGWPGNVRQLENVVERSLVLEDGAQVSLASMPDDVILAVETAGGLEGPAAPARSGAPAGDKTPSGTPAPAAAAAPASGPIRTLEEEEKAIIFRALEVTGWNIQEAASRLGVGRATIYRKIERYGLAPTDPSLAPRVLASAGPRE